VRRGSPAWLSPLRLKMCKINCENLCDNMCESTQMCGANGHKTTKCDKLCGKQHPNWDDKCQQCENGQCPSCANCVWLQSWANGWDNQPTGAKQCVLVPMCVESCESNSGMAKCAEQQNCEFVGQSEVCGVPNLLIKSRC
jgi:hypothetical protein